jgi:hypothetical protein
MKISQLISELQQAKSKHGDLLVTGAHIPGHPELTITGTGRVPAGPLQTASKGSEQEDLPERFLIEWEDF